MFGLGSQAPAFVFYQEGKEVVWLRATDGI